MAFRADSTVFRGVRGLRAFDEQNDVISVHLESQQSLSAICFDRRRGDWLCVLPFFLDVHGVSGMTMQLIYVCTVVAAIVGFVGYMYIDRIDR